MALYLGSTEPLALYLGSAGVQKAYLGATEVYSAAPFTWTPLDEGTYLVGLDPTDDGAVWQDTAGTTPAGTADLIARIDYLDASGSVQQATMGARPLRSADGFAAFDGFDDQMADGALAAAGQPFWAVIRFKLFGVASVNPIFGDTGGLAHFRARDVNYQWFAGSNLRGGSPTIATHTAVVVADGASSVIRIDGAAVATGSGGANGMGGGLVLGRIAGNTLNGAVGRFALFSGTPSAQQIANAETWAALAAS